LPFASLISRRQTAGENRHGPSPQQCSGSALAAGRAGFTAFHRADCRLAARV